MKHLPLPFTTHVQTRLVTPKQTTSKGQAHNQGRERANGHAFYSQHLAISANTTATATLTVLYMRLMAQTIFSAARLPSIDCSWELIGTHTSTNAYEGRERQRRTSEGCRQQFGSAPQSRRSRKVIVTRVVQPSSDGDMDYYGLLGVSPSADTREIKSAFRKAALRYHPDVNKCVDAAERFNEIRAAYQILSDPVRREQHDMSRSNKIKGSKIFGTSSPDSIWPTRSAHGDAPEFEEEKLYSFNEFVQDVQEEMAMFERTRSRGKHKTLWDELSTIGEEFVEFLEDVVEKPQEEVATVEEMPFNSCQKKMRRERKYSTSTRARESSSANQKMPNSKPFKATAGSANKGETIDDMLDQLKRDMGISSH